MALLFWEGFDTYANLTDLVSARPMVIPGYYVFAGAWPAYSSNGGRFNGKSVNGGSYTSWGLIGTYWINTPSEMYTGRAVSTPSNVGLICFWGSNGGTGTPDVYVNVVDGTILAYNGQGTLLGQSQPNIMQWNVYHWVEARAKMSSSTSTADGTVEVWLNNRKVISNTSCITKYHNSSTGYMGVNFGLGGTVGKTDDVYVLDTTGPSPWNSRLGDCRIATIAPTSDAGPNDGVPSTGIGNPHYAVVDEVPSSSSDYIELSSSANGYGEMFTHAELPSNNAAYILSTSVVVVGNKNDSGNGSFKISIKPPGTNTYNSNVQSLSTGATWYRQEWSANPNTGIQWSKADWANANIGFYIA